MDDEIEKVIKNGITEEELTKAKNITEADFISQKKNVLEKAQSIAKYFAYYGDPALINTEIDKYMKVTKEDVIAVAKKYFSKDKRVVLEYVPKGYKD
jgi:predicted Zn-dependent peptidase